MFGSEVYAVGGNRDAAMIAGIPVQRTLILVYAISGALAGLGGVILTGRLDSAQPIAATGLELNAIAAVVIGGASLFGGRGSMLGTILGVLLIGVINNGLTLHNVEPFWVQFIQGVGDFPRRPVQFAQPEASGRIDRYRRFTDTARMMIAPLMTSWMLVTTHDQEAESDDANEDRADHRADNRT